MEKLAYVNIRSFEWWGNHLQWSMPYRPTFSLKTMELY